MLILAPLLNHSLQKVVFIKLGEGCKGSDVDNDKERGDELTAIGLPLIENLSHHHYQLNQPRKVS